MDYKKAEERLKEAIQWVEGKGREPQIKHHRDSGRLLVRERINLLVDKGSWLEYGGFAHSPEPGFEEKTPGDAVVTGLGCINKRKVAIIGDDKTVLGGSHGSVNWRKIERILDIALKNNFPVISLSEGGGGRIPEILGVGLVRLFGLSELGFIRIGSRLKRPLFICAVFGPSYGDPAIRAGLADITIMVRDSAFALAGPPLVEAATGEVVTDAELGGPEVHKIETGLADIVVNTEEEAINKIKEILNILRPPESCSDSPERLVPELKDIVPEDHRRPYDMGDFIKVICDHGEWIELGHFYGEGLMTALGRMGGGCVAFLANQPKHIGGTIDAKGLRKASDFLKLVNKEGIPLIVLQDVPGLLIGKSVEKQGLLRELAGYIDTVTNINPLMLTLVIRKSYGVAYLFMGVASTGSQYVAAWSSAEIGFMVPEAAAAILLKNVQSDHKSQLIKKTAAELHNKASAWYAAGEGYIDAIILPEETRSCLCKTLELLSRK